MPAKEPPNPAAYFGDTPALDPLDTRIRSAESRLREILNVRAPGRDWNKHDAHTLIEASRRLHLAPLLCAHLESMLRSREVWRVHTVKGGGNQRRR